VTIATAPRARFALQNRSWRPI